MKLAHHPAHAKPLPETCVPPVRLAVMNQKGGVGKTTTAVNLATCLAEGGKKTLLLDLDPQGNATTHLGQVNKSGAHAAYALFQDRQSAPVPVATSVSALDLLTGSMDLAAVDVQLGTDSLRSGRLKAALNRLDLSGYGFVIVDCPPSSGLLTVSALVACNDILVPLQCEFFALEGLAHLTRTLEGVRIAHNPSLNLLGIVLTLYDRRNNLSDLVAADVRSFFGPAVMDTVIPRNVRLSEAPSHGLPITVYDPRSPGAAAYRKLTEEFLSRVAGRMAPHA